MDPIVPCFFVILIVGATVIGLVFAARQAEELNNTFRRVARHFQGTFQNRGFFCFSQPSVKFRHAGTYVMVDLHSTGGKNPKYYTQLHIAWPDHATRCDVFPENFFAGLGKFFGMDDIVIGSPRFDADYIIRGSSTQQVRSLLTPEVQSVINQLRTVSPVRDIYISWSGGKLLVKVQGVLRNFEPLRRLIALGLELFQQAMTSSAEGIDFLEQPAETPDTEVTCQICGEQIETELIYCQSCKTPHHRDCWQYYGACSTYGCGQKRFVVTK